MDIKEKVKKIVYTDIFTNKKLKENFAGRPFYIDYVTLRMIVADSWKLKVKGLPQGSFLLAIYENEEDVQEALLLRVLKPVKLPTDDEVISSMVEYYKDNLKTSGKESKLDDFTRYEFSFSGIECRILGTFYKDKNGLICFGADVENFYSANNYSVYKATGEVLEMIANYRDGQCIPGNGIDKKIGIVRYSSSRRFQEQDDKVPVYVYPKDFIGKRTALFGMTRTGKSNTVKKIVEITEEISSKVDSQTLKIDSHSFDETDKEIDPFTKNGVPKYPVGQIIFDINGEYANANLQDEGTAISVLYKNKVVIYSTLERTDVKVMKTNFYTDILGGYEQIITRLRAERQPDYVNSFMAVNLTPPDKEEEEDEYFSALTRYKRRVAAYLCCLNKAELEAPKGFKVSFEVNAQLRSLINPDVNPKNGMSLEDAAEWFSTLWERSESPELTAYFEEYNRDHEKPWIEEDLRSLLVFLTKKRSPTGSSGNISGYIKLRKMKGYHSATNKVSFEQGIIEELRQGKIVIIDLSLGETQIQNYYSNRICTEIFNNSLKNFTEMKPNSFIQFYFEEAHNLFPKTENRDLNEIYNRIAKEGAKLNLGLIYATQEVSSISPNILKNTQNWFVSHLNNEDELREIKKYYDFKDFTDNLISFNAASDKGFIRMKTYSNSYVVPVHIDRFLSEKDNTGEEK